jgi:hypothetical protein
VNVSLDRLLAQSRFALGKERRRKLLAISYSKRWPHSHPGGRTSSINRLFAASNGLTNLTPANSKPSRLPAKRSQFLSIFLAGGRLEPSIHFRLVRRCQNGPRPHRRCWIAGPGHGLQWSSRLGATPSSARRLRGASLNRRRAYERAGRRKPARFCFRCFIPSP